jgi:ribosomal-protein-alanine N-acetyltransferase
VPRTDRLLLRRWRAEDRGPFARINADRRVMRYMPATLDRPASDALLERFEADFECEGFAPWALERGGELLGFTGLARVRPPLPFAGQVEIGWRLRYEAWGAGYATEAARACVGQAFTDLGLRELVSFTSVVNRRSRAVMGRLGMTQRDEFEHPLLAPGHRLRAHVLYRLQASGASCKSGRRFASENRAWPGRREPE